MHRSSAVFGLGLILLLADTFRSVPEEDSPQETWARIFSSMGETYVDARTVYFQDGVESACGWSQSAKGSFYCPIDRKLYIDLDFYDTHVIAHEIGHHVQTLLGIERRVHQLQTEQPAMADRLSRLFELQADCLAGISARSVDGFDEALALYGTHSSDRVEWFRLGFESRRVASCNTFGRLLG